LYRIKPEQFGIAMKENIFGNIVEDGYRCKPAQVDPERPLKNYKYHLFVCDSPRCHEACQGLADKLRNLAEKENLTTAEHRIKITRSFCFGSCRFRSAAVIYSNPAFEKSVNDGLWIRNTQDITDEMWVIIFNKLYKNEPVKELLTEKFLMPLEDIEH